MEAPVSCTRCDRPICTDCMVSAPVGWQCPACVKDGPVVRSMRDIQPGGSLIEERPYVTFALIGASLLGYVLDRSDPALYARYRISGNGVAAGRLEQLVTSGFLHGDLIHIAFNMVLLYQLGSTLEARLGRIRFGCLYAAGLLGGAVGVLLLTDPQVPTLGASGAVFALMGATFVLPRRSRFGIEASVGGLIALNLVITFAIPGISIGGHIGGLVAGVIVGGVYRLLGESADQVRSLAGAGVAIALSIGLALAATPIARWSVEQGLGS